MGANRTQFETYSLDRAVCTLAGKVVFGASGAVSSQDCLGFTVTKPAATTGIYRITLEDKWQALLGVNPIVYNGGTADDISFELNDVDLSNKVIDLELLNGGSAADATSGHELYVTLVFRNSSVPRKGSS